MELFFYIFSISLQLAGALLLMIFSFSTKREKVIKRFCNKDIINQDENMEISYNEEEFKNTFKIAYLSKFSFCYIALGYIIGVLGTRELASKFTTILEIIICTILLMLCAYGITNIIIKYSKTVNKKITSDELKEYNIEPTMVELSNEEIDEIIDKSVWSKY